MIKISKKWIIIIIIVVLVAGYFVQKSVFKSPTEGLVTEKISKGDVLQEISETGSVKATEDLNLSFKTVGRVQSVNVGVGSTSTRGQILAVLDTTQTLSQLENAKSALDIAKREYDKLINGYTVEDIRIYQVARDSALQDLDGQYATSLNTLSDAYAKIYNSHSKVTTIRNSYFSSADQPGTLVQQSRDHISEKMQSMKASLDKAEYSKFQSDIDSAISQALVSLTTVYEDLRIIRIQCDQDAYYSKISSADKTSLDDQKSYISTALSNVTTLKNNIASYKIDLQKAQDDLALRQAEPRQEDIDVYKSKIDQAKANFDVYQSQLNDNYLIAPIDGIITEINIKRGQAVSALQSAISLLSSEPFQIKVNIYEQDIVNVKVGNNVKIELVAFPKQIFMGKVLSIDPAETIVDNVVYYQVTIDFPEQPAGIKSGMTADIVIETNKRENVVRVPKNAVTQIDGTEKVQILSEDKIEDRQITTGLEGNDYYEVLSGLSEDDTIITGKQ